MDETVQQPSDNATPAAPGALDGNVAFADYLKRKVLEVNSLEIQQLTVALYRLLGRGAPVTQAELGAACGVSPERTARLLPELIPSSLAFDDRRAIVAFGGLSLLPTRHRFATKAVELHTWCVLDGLFLSEILGQPATLITHCPASGAELTVEVAPGVVRAARPTGLVMSIVTPDTQACCENLRRAFCNHVNLFRDAETFRTWAQGRPGIGYVSLDEAQAFARQRNALRYPDIDLAASRPNC